MNDEGSEQLSNAAMVVISLGSVFSYTQQASRQSDT